MIWVIAGRCSCSDRVAKAYPLALDAHRVRRRQRSKIQYRYGTYESTWWPDALVCGEHAMPKRTLCYLARSAHAFCACTQASFRTLT